jgi:hypothetical protein
MVTGREGYCWACAGAAAKAATKAATERNPGDFISFLARISWWYLLRAG